MRTTLYASRWICLLTLAVVMLFSASEVDSQLGLACCRRSSSEGITNIAKCVEQKPRYKCDHHAYLIKDKNGKSSCISPDSQWLQDKIAKGLSCPSVISKHRFEVLVEDDVE